MLWLVLMLGVIGAAFYIVDKKIKEKYKSDDKFNPADWDLPGSSEMPADAKPQISLPAPASVEKISYEKKSGVLTPDHMIFYKALQAAVGSEYSILTNISAANVFAVAANSNPLIAQVATKNIVEKRFDFLICEKNTLAAACVLMLNDNVDSLLLGACESSKLPVARFRIQSGYDHEIIKEVIAQAVGQTMSTTSNSFDASLPTDALDIKPSAQKHSKEDVADNGIDVKFCPSCSAVMLKRKAKNGVNAGKMFWLCSTYPKCRGMRSI